MKLGALPDSGLVCSHTKRIIPTAITASGARVAPRTSRQDTFFFWDYVDGRTQQEVPPAETEPPSVLFNPEEKGSGETAACGGTDEATDATAIGGEGGGACAQNAPKEASALGSKARALCPAPLRIMGT